MDPRRWTPELLTARDVVADRDLSAIVQCRTCNTGRGFNLWKVGPRLADEPIRHLKLTCSKCGNRATHVQISRSLGGRTETAMEIPLKRPVAGYGSGLYFDP